jgi:anion-transporting  ArsA/GET3 family ATPase
LDKIDLFEWCGQIITSKETTASELASQRKALQEKDDEVKKLEANYEELVNLKNSHENELLEKFSLLLNEKKLKIRDQQRLLASSNVDPAKLAAVEEDRSERHHSAVPSRKGKRKAGLEIQSHEEESDGFENMDVDEAPNESEQEQPQTPPPEDESTADEASEDEAPVATHTRGNGNLRATPAEASSSKAPPPPVEAAVPPKRELPFQKKPAAKPAPVLEGSETESDNDEL